MTATVPAKLAAVAAIIASTVGVASTASAAQPARQGCFGESVSNAARAFAPFGANIVAPDARQGLISEDVRVIKAGELPDEVFPNTCN